MSPRTLNPLPCLWKSNLALSGPGVLRRDVSLLLSVLQATSGLMTVTVQQEGPPHSPSWQGCACCVLGARVPHVLLGGHFPVPRGAPRAGYCSEAGNRRQVA